jgi:hypothetical protein
MRLVTAKNTTSLEKMMNTLITGYSIAIRTLRREADHHRGWSWVSSDSRQLAEKYTEAADFLAQRLAQLGYTDILDSTSERMATLTS